ncbi:5-methyltetrahydropteroyltriglutamate--homocysteine S-methyltransferase [Paenibacillus sp. GCM10027626]|uniref:5-methyltetrahydropteroyltriglutamate-- homocysteine S-methyltransferase n=1 Tax=Paenibacillus sp. GCM10027626 TaxID=3273411 RepID=UPI00362EEE44
MSQIETISTREITPFRFDIVGSFLRPQALKDARQKFQNNEISATQLRAVEDQEIVRLIAKQKQVGLKAVTDGEFRRSWWHLDFMWGFNGIEKFSSDKGYVFKGFVTRAETARVSGKIQYNPNHPFIEHFMFLKEAAGEGVIARQAIPAPAQILHEVLRGDNRASTDAVYASVDEVIADLAEAYRQTILAFYAAGCRSLQLDDTTWGVLCDPKNRAVMESSGTNVDEALARYAKINEIATNDLPGDLVITTHVCRGNFRSTYMATGSYDVIADAYFNQPNYDAYYLEFDTERAGGFEVLKGLKGRKVVLGLVSSKTGELEDRAHIIARIREAAQYVNLDDICLSPQCGFASTEEGNLLTEEEQWKKLAFIRDVAGEVWG